MDLRPTCAKCKCTLDSSSIRTLPDGGGYVCRDCLELKGGRTISHTSSEPLHNDAELFGKKSYLCQDCSYQFERSATFYVRSCPMCASEVVHEISKEPSAEDLIYQ